MESSATFLTPHHSLFSRSRWQSYEPPLWALVFSYIVAGIFYASLNKPWRRAADWR
jgi:hypothetical protein